MQGTPTNLRKLNEVKIDVTTESEEGGNHDVFFNRGAAASQEYARRFDNQVPNESNPDDKRWAWLSRGAMEAIAAFTARAKNESWGLRVAAYEFRLDLFADALLAAHDRGADVKILYDACANPADEHGEVFPRDKNRAAALAARVNLFCQERVTRNDVKNAPISHHKFIVLLKNGNPEAVLTGSTNFSRGGRVRGVQHGAYCRECEDRWRLLEVRGVDFRQPQSQSAEGQSNRNQPDPGRATAQGNVCDL